MTKRIVASTEVVGLRTIVERKSESLPRFVVVPSSLVLSWKLSGTTVVEVCLDGTAIGRRSLKRWAERDAWFLDLTEEQCERARVDTGDEVDIELRKAASGPPAEIRELIEGNASAGEAWTALTDYERRSLAEHVRAGKRPATRRRRAARGLGLDM